jgi:hypothetical protein
MSSEVTEHLARLFSPNSRRVSTARADESPRLSMVAGSDGRTSFSVIATGLPYRLHCGPDLELTVLDTLPG